jgi:hypothetical protein
MTARILLIAAAVAWVATLAGLVWMVDAAGMLAADVLWVLRHLNFMPMAFVVVSGLMGVAGIVCAVLGRRAKAFIGASGAFGWGAVGALYGAAGARTGLIGMNPPIPFAVYAPSYAEALIVLLIGLTGAVLSLAVLNARRRAAA